MNKLINVLEIISNDQSPDEIFYGDQGNLLIITIILNFIFFLIFLFIFSLNINKPIFTKKIILGFTVFPIVYILTIIILSTIVTNYKTGYIPTIIPGTEEIKEIKLKEGTDYIITKNEEVDNISIIIEFKSETTIFEYNYKIYNKDKKLVYAYSDSINNIKANSYQTIKINKPTEVALEGGSYEFNYIAKYQKTIITDTEIKGIEVIIISIIAGLIGAITIPQIPKFKDNHKEE